MTYNVDLNVVVTAAATILGTLLGGLVTLVTTRRQNKMEALVERNVQLSKDLARASEQVAAFSALEAEYAREVGQFRNSSARTVKIEFRDRVEHLGFPRPNWTVNDARESLESALEQAGG